MEIGASLGIRLEQDYAVTISWIARTPNAPAWVDGYGVMGDCRFVVEYDGYPWHEGKSEVDLRKTNALLSSGLVDLVVRVRDARLTPLDDVSGMLQVMHDRKIHTGPTVDAVAEKVRKEVARCDQKVC